MLLSDLFATNFINLPAMFSDNTLVE